MSAIRQRKLRELSRDAQVAALTFFLTGKDNEVTFSKEKHVRLHPKFMSGLGELIGAGMVECHEHKSIINYTALDAIGHPMGDVPGLREDEAYPLFINLKSK